MPFDNWKKGSVISFYERERENNIKAEDAMEYYTEDTNDNR